MRKDREKRTAAMASLQHWLRRSYYCCNQARGGGFTLAEILIVVLIIAIAAMIAVPMMGSMDSMQIRSAANMIAADLEYAKSMAISRQENYSVVFNETTESYQIFKDQGGTLVPIEHPVKKTKETSDYIVNFSTDSRLNKVVIESVNFDNSPSKTITFDSLGSPHSGSETLPHYLTDEGEINLKAGDFTMTVSVEPVTGFISIE
jgi:prepilin-type N-terminal cleavage/methylation domain-containing protein